MEINISWVFPSSRSSQTLNPPYAISISNKSSTVHIDKLQPNQRFVYSVKVAKVRLVYFVLFSNRHRMKCSSKISISSSYMSKVGVSVVVMDLSCFKYVYTNVS